MDSGVLVGFAAVGTAVVYMTGAFLWARAHNRYDILQLIWGLGCASIVAVTYFVGGHSIGFNLQTLLVVLVTLWGVRLYIHLHRKWIRLTADDRRYQRLRRDYAAKRGGIAWNMYGKVYLIQGAWAVIVTLPATIVMAHGTTPFDAWMLIGVVLWGVGFACEALGDHQLRLFRDNSANRGKILNTGLWRYSRHPNLFGESLQWWGVYCLACTVTLGWTGILGPLVVTWLLVFSGISVRERQMKHRAGWAEYARRTSIFVPLPPKNVDRQPLSLDAEAE